jgi:two-component system, cell cycle sensor histidine kinase and response regulator CckA
VQPVVLDVNDVLTDMNKMLRRLIDEHIELTVTPGKDIGRIRADSGYVGQVLMNLVVNARDAMPNGGKLTIETSNTAIDEAYVRNDPAAHAGDYVLLAVTDTGIGMDEATAAQIFEPFFTTKQTGEGTGLGLATVYGIVRQNQGFINVYSERGYGATFKLYFPRFTGTPESRTEQAPGKALAAGERKGTILLVEDDDLVRSMTADTLVFLGYTPLTAATPQQAIEICCNPATQIDLVVSDVVMAGMKATDLRDRLVERRPGLKVLFVSGYTSNVIVRHGILKPGVDFLQKPFSVESLGARIEGLLSPK